MIRVEIIIRNPENPDKGYIITSTDRCTWIEILEDGEGMEIDSQNFFNCIDTFYKENF